MHLVYLLSSFLFVACASKNVVQNSNTNMPKRTIQVANSTQLQQALNNAKPNDEIVLADGIYTGNFIIPSANNGTKDYPIYLIGTAKAVLDGSTIQTGYVLYLQASFWNLKGFTITNGLKGLMCDEATNNTIEALTVFGIGEEAIHLRKFSKYNTVRNCIVYQAGLKTPDYGEGIYIGTAVSNWPKYTNGKEDKCDSNLVVNNKVGPNITAECIDIKEGTTGNIIRNNFFDATGITGANSADSWIDVKGNYTLIEGNTGTNPGGSIFLDGYQVHCVAAGWGSYNTFSNNNCTVNAAGYGFNIVLKSSKGEAIGNKVLNNNTVIGAQKGIANIALSNQ